MWVIGTSQIQGGYEIYRWVKNNWEKTPGGAVRVSVDTDGSAWVVNNTGNIFHSSVTPSRAAAPACDESRRPLQHCTTASAPATQVQWTTQSGSATDIAVGANGDVWMIGTDRSGNDYGIYKAVFASGTRNVSSWQKVDGGAVRIAVGPDGSPWVVNSSGNVYNRVDGGWAQLAINGITDISIGPDGTPYLTANGQGGSGAVMRLMPSGMNPSAPGAMAWIPVPFSNLAATNVAAAAPGTVYITRDSANQNAILWKNGLPVASSTLASNAQPWSPPATPAPGIVNASSGPCAAGYKLEGTTCVQDCPPNYSDKDDNTCGRTMTAYQASGGACKPGAHLWAGSLCVQDCPPGMKEQNLFCMKNCYPSGGSASAATSCTAKAGSVAATPGAVASPTPPPQTGASRGPASQPLPTLSPTWTTLPTSALDVGANAKGDLWVIGGDRNIYRWSGTNWTQVPGGAVRISVDPDGTAWVVNGDGAIFHSTPGNQWTTQNGSATDIGVGANGDVWAIGSDRSGNDYGIYQAIFAPGTRNVSSWQKVDGAAVRIAVGPDGTPWIVDSYGSVYFRQNNRWFALPFRGYQDVSVAADGTPYLVASGQVGAGGQVFALRLLPMALVSASAAINPIGTNVAAGGPGTIYVTQDSSNHNAILSASGLPVMPQLSAGASTSANQSQGSTASLIDAGFDYCWKDSHGRGVGQPLSTNSSDCPAGTVKDPTGLLCYPPCKAGYDMVGPVCWQHGCPTGWRDDGLFCRPTGQGYSRAGNTYPWVGGDNAGDPSGQFARCNGDNSQGCEQIPPGMVNLVYPKCKAGYHSGDHDGGSIYDCVPDANSCPGGKQMVLGSCPKDTYTNGVGQTLGCPKGMEQDGLLCYSSCGPNSHGVGPVCYDDCPSGWVQCGAGCAKDVASCATNTTQQVMSIIQSAAQIVLTVATMGAATPGLDAANKLGNVADQKIGDEIAQDFVDNSTHSNAPENGGSNIKPVDNKPPAGSTPDSGSNLGGSNFHGNTPAVSQPGTGGSNDLFAKLDTTIDKTPEPQPGQKPLIETIDKTPEPTNEGPRPSADVPTSTPASPNTGGAGDLSKFFDNSDEFIEQDVQRIGADRTPTGRLNLMKAKLDEVKVQQEKISKMSESDLNDAYQQWLKKESCNWCGHRHAYAQQQFDMIGEVDNTSQVFKEAAQIMDMGMGEDGIPKGSMVDDISFYRWYLSKCRKAVFDALYKRAQELGMSPTDAYPFRAASYHMQSWADFLGEFMHGQCGWTGYVDYLDNEGTRPFEFFEQINPAPVAEVPGSSLGGTAVADRAEASPATFRLVDASFSEAAPDAALAQAGSTPPTPSNLTPQQLKRLMNNVQNMTPDQLQNAATRAAQQVANANIAQSVSNLPPVTADTLNTVVTVTAKNTNSSTPLAPPSISSLLPVADVINKITAASNSTTLSPEAKNMQIAMAALEGAAALDPTGIVGIVSAYTKPLCSLVTQNTNNNPGANTAGEQVAAQASNNSSSSAQSPPPPPQAYTKFMNVSAGYIGVLSNVTDAASVQANKAGIQAVMPQYNQALAQLQGVSLSSDQQAAVNAQQQLVNDQLKRVRSLPGGVQATRKQLPGDD